MLRVPVLDKNKKPLMPTKASRARRWIIEGKAIGKMNDQGNVQPDNISFNEKGYLHWRIVTHPIKVV